MAKERIPGIPNKFNNIITCKCLKGTKETKLEESFTSIQKVGEICNCFIGTSLQTNKRKKVARVFISKVDQLDD